MMTHSDPLSKKVFDFRLDYMGNKNYNRIRSGAIVRWQIYGIIAQPGERSLHM